MLAPETRVFRFQLRRAVHDRGRQMSDNTLYELPKAFPPPA